MIGTVSACSRKNNESEVIFITTACVNYHTRYGTIPMVVHLFIFIFVIITLHFDDIFALLWSLFSLLFTILHN